jgi:hypothetical protein
MRSSAGRRSPWRGGEARAAAPQAAAIQEPARHLPLGHRCPDVGAQMGRGSRLEPARGRDAPDGRPHPWPQQLGQGERTDSALGSESPPLCKALLLPPTEAIGGLRIYAQRTLLISPLWTTAAVSPTIQIASDETLGLGDKLGNKDAAGDGKLPKVIRAPSTRRWKGRIISFPWALTSAPAFLSERRPTWRRGHWGS